MWCDIVGYLKVLSIMVQDNPKLLDGGEKPTSQGRGWRIDFPAVKSPLYLAENLLGDQLPCVL